MPESTTVEWNSSSNHSTDVFGKLLATDRMPHVFKIGQIVSLWQNFFCLLEDSVDAIAFFAS
ncbi:hypothetical protein [Phormidium sp. CCY1219]|jgi:hypothetical protein|uniref:hypothetical protein n=1 Tax=Phormidium sp. CCY1219 TaxID=2886104 RepID=UPI002D1E8EDC|nr:hypothetical protein [Phormidium sp. CCY1219]MEB3828549.1 hypothetical protein [Phormidium sp. CCY1219]